MHSALQIEPDLIPSFENKVQGSFHAPPWLFLGLSCITWAFYKPKC